MIGQCYKRPAPANANGFDYFKVISKANVSLIISGESWLIECLTHKGPDFDILFPEIIPYTEIPDDWIPVSEQELHVAFNEFIVEQEAWRIRHNLPKEIKTNEDAKVWARALVDDVFYRNK